MRLEHLKVLGSLEGLEGVKGIEPLESYERQSWALILFFDF